MSYGLSLRWLKFAFIAGIGWLIVSIPILLGLVAIGHPEWLAVTLIAFIPFAVWYFRRYARDKKEFEAGRR